MPARWCLDPNGKRIELADAPMHFEEQGLMPHYAVEALLKGMGEGKAAFNVRPSDVVPKFVCRRQRVWMTNHDYGVNPLELEAMEEGSALHEKYGTQEIEVPAQVVGTVVRRKDGTEELVEYKPGGDIPIDEGDEILAAGRVPAERIEVCGVPMRGRIDFLFPERIEDIKTSTPFWIPRFPSKEAKAADPTLRPYADIYVNASFEEDDIKSWRIQLSIYRVLLEKEGKPVPVMGRVWRRLSGVKADTPGRWKKFDFELLDEAGLEAEVGPWMRELARGLQLAADGDADAWQQAPGDGKEMTSSRKGLWKCNRCPLKDACYAYEGLEVF